MILQAISSHPEVQVICWISLDPFARGYFFNHTKIKFLKAMQLLDAVTSHGVIHCSWKSVNCCLTAVKKLSCSALRAKKITIEAPTACRWQYMSPMQPVALKFARIFLTTLKRFIFHLGWELPPCGVFTSKNSLIQKLAFGMFIEWTSKPPHPSLHISFSAQWTSSRHDFERTSHPTKENESKNYSGPKTTNKLNHNKLHQTL